MTFIGKYSYRTWRAIVLASAAWGFGFPLLAHELSELKLATRSSAWQR